MNWLLCLALLFLPQGRGATSSTGIVTGQLRSPDKGATAQVVVSAMFADDGAGKVLRSVRTDNDGRFVLDGLRPGRYYIFAGPEEFPFYYPGVTTGKDARIVYVTAGATTPGIDITIRRVGVRIAGRVLDDRVTVLGSDIWLVAPDGIAAHTNLRDNRFEFLNVLPGPYTIEGSKGLGLNPIPLQVAHEDITNLQLVVPSARFFSVSGRIVNTVPARPLDPSQQVTLLPVSTSRVPVETAVRSDGTFTFKDLMPGVYTVSAGPAIVLSSDPIEVVDRDVSGLELRVVPQIEANVHVVLENGLSLPLPISVYKFTPTGKSGPEGLALENQPTAVAFGDNYFFFRASPALAVKSARSGSTDLLRQPLNVKPSTNQVAIEVVVQTNPPGSRALFRIAGQEPGFAGLKVRVVDTLLPAEYASLAAREQSLNAKGEFEFLVEAGVYRLEFPDVPGVAAEVIVLGKDISGIELRLPAKR
ncbi:MAG TPA: hypothetical protein VFY29_11085 [Terriglobia bacterium]|nr:hypothetical protein [Terriglobia bacterium]